jgi:nucleoside-diphosphate-sugar epimerase
VKVVRGDVTRPRCGLSDADCAALNGRIHHVVNSAASINFFDKDITHATNVAGVRNVLDLMGMVGAKHILQVSTAYVVGDGAFLSEKGLSNGQAWHNSYEESKFRGEAIVRNWATANDGREFTICRPSVLVGSEDGTTSTFDGHYRYFEPMHRTAENLRKRSGAALPPDVFVERNGMVHAPLAILAADKRINYIPIDWVADMIVAALAAPTRNETYNLVHDNPPRTRDCLAWSLDHLKIGGIVVCDTQADKDAAVKAQGAVVNRMQRRIDVVHDAYTPYCTKDPAFEMQAASRNFGKMFRSPPIIDRRFLSRTLDYALQKNWGAKKVRVDEPV